MKYAIVSILILSYLGTNNSNSQITKDTPTRRSPVVDTLDTKKILDEARQADTSSQKKLANFRKGLKEELKDCYETNAKEHEMAAYWKKVALAGQRELAAIKSQPVKTDTIWANPMYSIIRTIYKGLVPKPGINKKKQEKTQSQVKDMFIEIEQVEFDTVNYEIIYTRKN